MIGIMVKTPKYSVLGFWTMVLRRSIISWHQVEGLLALAAYASLIWLGLASFGVFTSVLSDALQKFFSVIAVGWLVFLIVIFTPYQLWKEASEERDKLKDIKDYEDVLDRLSEHFNYGNNDILNGLVLDTENYLIWKERWDSWSGEVEEFLEENFNLAEKNLFKNNVLFHDHKLEGCPGTNHGREKSVVANQLQTLRKIIVRHSEKIQKWRAENTSP